MSALFKTPFKDLQAHFSFDAQKEAKVTLSELAGVLGEVLNFVANVAALWIALIAGRQLGKPRR